MKLGVRLSWFGVRKTVNIDALLESLGATASRIVNALSSAARRKPDNAAGGGANRNRTDDLLHAMQTLYQLSYGPKMRIVTLAATRPR